MSTLLNDFDTFSTICRKGDTARVVRRLADATRSDVNALFQTVVLIAPFETLKHASRVVETHYGFDAPDYNCVAIRSLCRRGCRPRRLQWVMAVFAGLGHRPKLLHANGISVQLAMRHAPAAVVRWVITALRLETDVDTWRSVVARSAMMVCSEVSKLVTTPPHTTRRLCLAFRMAVQMSGVSLRGLMDGFRAHTGAPFYTVRRRTEAMWNRAAFHRDPVRVAGLTLLFRRAVCSFLQLLAANRNSMRASRVTFFQQGMQT